MQLTTKIPHEVGCLIIVKFNSKLIESESAPSLSSFKMQFKNLRKLISLAYLDHMVKQIQVRI